MSIKIITEPKVYLVGSSASSYGGVQDFLNDQGVPDWMTDAPSSGEGLAEVAGRLCYESFARPRPGGNKAYIDHILEVGHGSVLEHATYNLIFTGVSRSLTHELVRHRVGMSYSQLSQRYVDESDVAFVPPPALLDEVRSAAALVDGTGCMAIEVLEYRAGQLSEAERAGLYWLGLVESSLLEYRRLSYYLEGKYAAIPDKTARRKQAREAARSVLPNCVETKIFVTGNGRSLRHLIELRGNAAADAEIRRLAEAVLSVLVNESPNIFGDYTTDADGSITTPYRKV